MSNRVLRRVALERALRIAAAAEVVVLLASLGLPWTRPSLLMPISSRIGVWATLETAQEWQRALPRSHWYDRDDWAIMVLIGCTVVLVVIQLVQLVRPRLLQSVIAAAAAAIAWMADVLLLQRDPTGVSFAGSGALAGPYVWSACLALFVLTGALRLWTSSPERGVHNAAAATGARL